MLISSNYNYSYSFQRKKTKQNNKQEDKSKLDQLKKIHEQNSELATDFASALLMSKINFISKLLSPQKYNAKQNEQQSLSGVDSGQTSLQSAN